MSSEKNSSEQKAKTRKCREVKLSPTEEIVVKLASDQTKPEQVQGDQKPLSDGPDQLQQKLDDLKTMNQMAGNEIEALKKHLQTVEKSVAAKFEAMQSTQLESERQRLHLESKIHGLEKIMTALTEKQRVDKSTVQSLVPDPPTVEMKKTTGPGAVVANAAKPKPLVTPEQKAATQAAKLVKSLEAKVSTTAFATNRGCAVQSTVRLSGKEVFQFTRDRAPFQIAWYAHKLGGGGSILLKTSHANLVANNLEYTISADLPRLVTGPYRLTTVATFPTAHNLMTHCQGPVIQAT